ncbi:MAG: hypothetical protein LBV39_06760 [Bacteroidales bacterium]|jgi:hypothetical protein|nr:hypothetical protein [Bacteroidales bacterium]
MNAELNILSKCSIRNQCVYKNDQKLFEAPDEPNPPAFMAALYKDLRLDYRKFFKMDNLSKLAFLASEVLLDGLIDRETPHRDIAVVLFNRSASLDIDATYRQSIRDRENFFPSPSEFVYTLPNIMTGEIAIRNKLFGETACFISEKFDIADLYRKVSDVMDDTVQQCICGWVEYCGNHYEAEMFLVSPLYLS